MMNHSTLLEQIQLIMGDRFYPRPSKTTEEDKKLLIEALEEKYIMKFNL